MPRIHFVKDCILFTTMVVVDMVTLYFLRKRHNVRAWGGRAGARGRMQREATGI